MRVQTYRCLNTMDVPNDLTLAESLLLMTNLDDPKQLMILTAMYYIHICICMTLTQIKFASFFRGCGDKLPGGLGMAGITWPPTLLCKKAH